MRLKEHSSNDKRGGGGGGGFFLSARISLSFQARHLILVLKDRGQKSYLESTFILAIFSIFFSKSQKSNLTLSGLRRPEKSQSWRIGSKHNGMVLHMNMKSF